LGIFQPFADAVKLLTKESLFIRVFNLLIYYLVPCLGLSLILLFWFIFNYESRFRISYELVYVLIISRLSVYIILGAGWSSNSKYAILGAYRGVAQTISYEVRFSFIILSLLYLTGRFNLSLLGEIQGYVWFTRFLWNLLLIWLVTILAETNRTPFDFAEGESELVSGFNVEFGAGGFTLLFMAEYGNIIFIRFITSILFFGGPGFLVWKMIGVLIFFLWIRGTLVRFRYDNLIILAWKLILPYRIILLIINIILFILI